MQWRDANRCGEALAVWLSKGSREDAGRVFSHCRGSFNSLTACGVRPQNAIIHQVYPGKISSPQLN